MGKESTQESFLKNEPSAYGGELRRKRKGRTRARPLAAKQTMHLVLRSTQAQGKWSFSKNRKLVQDTVSRYANLYGVKVLKLANVGNHLHFHIQLGYRSTYKSFIRALTGSLAMAITKASRWTQKLAKPFWDYRPFTRIVQGYKDFLNLRTYIALNEIEGYGHSREEAIVLLDKHRYRQKRRL